VLAGVWVLGILFLIPDLVGKVFKVSMMLADLMIMACSAWLGSTHSEQQKRRRLGAPKR
jgi:hypothetical protein